MGEVSVTSARQTLEYLESSNTMKNRNVIFLKQELKKKTVIIRIIKTLTAHECAISARGSGMYTLS